MNTVLYSTFCNLHDFWFLPWCSKFSSTHYYLILIILPHLARLTYQQVPLLQTTLIDALQVARLHQSSKQKEKSYTQNKVLTKRAFWCAVPWPRPEYLFVVPKWAPQNRRQTVLPRSRRPRDSPRRSQTAQQTVKGRRGWEWRRTSLQRRWGGCRGTGWPNAWSERQPWKESMHLAFKVQQMRCTWQNHIPTLHP